MSAKSAYTWLPCDAHLIGANQSGADLGGADLGGANLRRANLSGANLSGAKLSDAKLSDAKLSDANLSGANLSGADLSRADLRRADLSGADLSGANLSGADLSDANLSGADLSGANLSGADMSGADLSGVKGLLSAAEWMAANFEKSGDGYIVNKRIGNTEYVAPAHWVIEPGQYITEVPNANRTEDCGCGVNFGTKEFCEKNYTNADWWECLLEWADLADLCVPYNTDGKARCARLKLIRKIS